jgi:hypothetical protein
MIRFHLYQVEGKTPELEFIACIEVKKQRRKQI